MDNVIRLKQATFVNIVVDPDYNVHVIYLNNYVKVKKYPLFYFDKNGYSDSPYSVISSSTYRPYIASIVYNKTLYISPDSKLSRDLIRNSGYKITYSEDKADYIVIPKPLNNDYEFLTNLVVLNTSTNELYVCNINDRSYSAKYDAEFFVDKLAQELGITNKSILDYHSNNNVYTLFHVWWFKGCKEYEDILRGASGEKYILDSALPLTPANKLSVETLDLWRRLASSDDNLLEKSILNSDARDYPFTMYNFIYFDSEMRYKSRPQKVRWMMENMGINNDWPSNKPIEPKDLNLMQDYICYLLGLEGKSGYVSYQQYTNLPYQYQRLIMTRFAVCPVRIDSPTIYSNIQSIAKNS